MDLESTLETISQYIPEDVESTLANIAGLIPEDWKYMLDDAAACIPKEISVDNMMWFLLIFCGGFLLFGILGRVILGKRSSLNHSVSSAMAILFVYAITIVVYTFEPKFLTDFLSPLPFVSFHHHYMIVFPIKGAGLPLICNELLSLIILAFLVNLIDTLMPKGDNTVTWFLLRVLMILVTMALHYGFGWLMDTYLPDVLLLYAPVILIGILLALLLTGVAGAVAGLLLAAVDPIIGGICGFLFGTTIGKQLTKAMFTSAIICCIVFLLEYLGIHLIDISLSSLITYIPLGLASLLLWHLLGYVL